MRRLVSYTDTAITILFVMLGVAHTVRFWGWDFDDGFIVYRIAEHIGSGLGWTYNVGEARNASTSVLNTVILSLVSMLGFPVRGVAHVLAGIWITAVSFLTWQILRRSKSSKPLATFAGATAGFFLAYANAMGLEIFLFAALLLLSIFELQTRKVVTRPSVSGKKFEKKFGATLGLTILSRPDGVLVSILTTPFLIRSGVKTILKVAWFAFLPLVPWLLFSFTKFGQFLPDTLGSKMWQARSSFWGTGYLYWEALRDRLTSTHVAYSFIEQFIPAFGAVLPYFDYAVSILFILGLVLLTVRKDPLLVLGWFALIQQALYCVINVPFYHWYSAIFDLSRLTIAFWLVGFCFSFFSSKNARYARISNLVTVLGLVAVTLGYSLVSYTQPLNDSGNRHYIVAAAALSTMQEGTLAATEVGTLGFLTKRKMLDLTGLTTPQGEMLTGKNSDVFFSEAPELILLHEPVWDMERTIFQDARFKFCYLEKQKLSGSFAPVTIYERACRQEPSKDDLALFSKTFPQWALDTIDISTVAKDKADRCTVDSLNGQLLRYATTQFSKDSLLTIRGWSVFAAGDTGEAYRVVLSDAKGSYVLNAQRIDRPDVARAFGSKVDNVGYEVTGGLSDIPEGTYRIGIVMSGARRCDTSTKISLK